MGASGVNDVRWEGLTHDEIYSRVQQGPGRLASADAEAAWGTVESTIRAVDDQLSRAVKQIGVDWQGAAADSVRGGMTVMSNWALDAAGDALLTRDGIAGQADAAGHVRTSMPPPRSSALDQAVQQGLNGTGYVPRIDDVGALEDGIAADRARAVDLMNRYTSDSSSNQRLMNFWTPPPSVVVETVVPGAAGAGHGPGISGAVGAAAGIAAAGVVAGRIAGRGAATGATAGTGGAPGEADAALGPAVGTGSAAPGVGVSSGPGGRAAFPGTRATPPVPVVPGVPGAGSARAGAATPGAAGRTGSPSGLPNGGVRPVVPGLPARPGGSLPGSGVPGSAVPGGRDIPPGALVPGSPTRSTGGLSGGGPGPGAPAPRPSVGAPGEGVVNGRLSETTAGAGRGAPVAGQGFVPLGGVGGRSGDQDHRRPNYLVDDTDAFADDRWFTPPVIGGDDPEVVRA